MEIFVETERLVLREILPSDAYGMYELDSDPEVQKYVGNNPISSISEAERTIESIRNQYLNNGIGRWAVIEKNTGNFIGWSGLKLVTETTNNHINYHDIGYRLIRKYWGKGFATESATAVLKYGFNKFLLKKIYAIADVNNSSSKKVLEKIGLKCVETFEYQGISHYWYQTEMRNNESLPPTTE
jgi:ribosomal-protein-alanine N-acetyltransferase